LRLPFYQTSARVWVSLHFAAAFARAFCCPNAPDKIRGEEVPAGSGEKPGRIFRRAFQSQPPPAGGTMYIHKIGAAAYEAALAELAWHRTQRTAASVLCR